MSSKKDDLQDAPHIEGYSVKKLLGRGSTGTVWLARQESMDRDVAIKLLHPDTRGDEQLRFLRESRILANLNHPNLIKVYNVLKTDGTLALIMERVDGSSLADVVETGGPLSEDQVRHIVLQTLEALDHAHDHGIFHRDIKPENIIMGLDNQIRLADLGLARFSMGSKTLTSIDTVIGTPAYMPPEQARDSHNVTKQSDYYSLGATAYHLLTGQPPYVADTAIDVLVMLEQTPPIDIRKVDPVITAATRKWVNALIARNPSKRPQSAEDIRTLINKSNARLQLVIGGIIFIALTLAAAYAAAMQKNDRGNNRPEQPTVIETTDKPPDTSQATMNKIRENTARNLLNEIQGEENRTRKLELIEAMLSGYGNTTAADEAKLIKKATLAAWNEVVRHKLQSYEVSFDEALAAPNFKSSEALLLKVSMIEPGNPWWQSERDTYLTGMRKQLATRVDSWLDERLTAAARLEQSGNLISALEKIEEALTVRADDAMLLSRQQDLAQAIESRRQKKIREIELYLSGELRIRAKKRHWDSIRDKLKSLQNDSVGPQLHQELQPLVLVSSLLPALEARVEKHWLAKKGQKLALPTRNNQTLEVTIEKSTDGHAIARVSASYAKPVLDLLAPGESTKILLTGKRDKNTLHAAALWADLVENETILAQRLMKEALAKGLPANSPFVDLAE